MSNERIDLEQFEGMTKGPWRIPEHAAEIVDSEDYAVLWVDFSGESPAEYMFRNSALHCANKEDIEAMAKVPELIAELKRCYDLIDCLEDEMEFVLQQLHRPIMGGLEWYEVRNNILNQLVTNANSSTIQVLEALEQPASE